MAATRILSSEGSSRVVELSNEAICVWAGVALRRTTAAFLSSGFIVVTTLDTGAQEYEGSPVVQEVKLTADEVVGLIASYQGYLDEMEQQQAEATLDELDDHPF